MREREGVCAREHHLKIAFSLNTKQFQAVKDHQVQNNDNATVTK